MKRRRDSHSLVEFHQNAPELVEQLKATGEPLTLTIDGKPELVVQSAASYQKLREIADEAWVMERIRLSLEEAARGEGLPVEEAFEQIRGDLNLSDD